MDDINKFIPFEVSEEDIVDTSSMTDEEFRKEYISKLQDFNDNTSGKKFCYVLKLNSDVDFNIENKISNSIICKRNNSYMIIIYERYITKTDLSILQDKFFPNNNNTFDIVYEGGFCYRNQIKDKINDKRKRLDLYR